MQAFLDRSAKRYTGDPMNASQVATA